MAKQLVRETRLGGAIVIGLGSILGTGAYVSIGLSASVAGDLLVWAIVIAALTALCNGLSSAQLAAAHPVSGGTYEYGYRFLNPSSGKIAGYLFIIAKSASAATAALAVATYLNGYLEFPTWTVKAIAAVLLLAFTITVLAGIKRTNLLNVIIVVIGVSGLLVFIAVAFTQPIVNSVAVSPDDSDSSLFHAAALMFVAFTGYGRIATMGEEITEPRHNIPRAVWLTLGLITGLYILIGMAVLRIFDSAALQANDFTISQLITEPTWQWAVVIGGIVAMAGVVLNLVLGVSRVVLAMGRRGDLPRTMANLNEKGESAPAATWATFFIMATIAILGGIQSAWTLSAFTVLTYYAITNIAALKVAAEDRFIPRWVSLAGLVSCTGLVILAAVT